MLTMVDTDATFHLLTSPLNCPVPANICAIVITLATFQFATFPLNACTIVPSACARRLEHSEFSRVLTRAGVLPIGYL